jgi:hypothetical protein
MGTVRTMLLVFGLGIAYFLAAIPTGVSMKLAPWLAAICAWAGYTAIAAAMLVIGAPARVWIVKKFKFSTEPDTTKVFWRIWTRYGMPGLGLIAPVTIGPYFAALVALALGEKPRRLMFWIAVGVIPWCIAFALASDTLRKMMGI